MSDIVSAEYESRALVRCDVRDLDYPDDQSIRDAQPIRTSWSTHDVISIEHSSSDDVT